MSFSKLQRITFIVITVFALAIPIILLLFRHSRNFALPVNKDLQPNYELQQNKYEFTPTHAVSIYTPSPYGVKRVTIRRKPMTAYEYKLANSGTSKGTKLNNETVVDYLQDGTLVELLGQFGLSYKIRYKNGNEFREGYLVISVSGKPTLYPLRGSKVNQ